MLLSHPTPVRPRHFRACDPKHSYQTLGSCQACQRSKHRGGLCCVAVVTCMMSGLKSEQGNQSCLWFCEVGRRRKLRWSALAFARTRWRLHLKLRAGCFVNSISRDGVCVYWWVSDLDGNIFLRPRLRFLPCLVHIPYTQYTKREPSNTPSLQSW